MARLFQVIPLLVAGLAVATGSLGTSSAVETSVVCSILDVVLPSKVSFPSESVYQYEESEYWSFFQSNQTPACRISPTTAEDVALAISILRVTSTKFAIKSGGHAMMAGASNIDGGVTLDLLNMSSIVISHDRKTVSFGAGLRWAQVYSYLDEHQLGILGGRVAGIGVGGLTTGGGISFFSNEKGFVCDGVKNFEVVIANGQIVNANATHNSDLWWALKGGGNNFGVVTRMDVDSFELGQMWGGTRTYAGAQNGSLLQALEHFCNDLPTDPKAALYLAFAAIEGLGLFGVTEPTYALPTPEPPIFAEFSSIPSTSNTSRITGLTNLTLEVNLSNPSGLREMYSTATFLNSASLNGEILNIFLSEMQPIVDSSAANFTPAITLQCLSTAMTSKAASTGGNALGVGPEHGPLVLLDISLSWSNPADDERIMSAARSFISRSVAYAKSVNLSHPFVYMNYASLDEDVFDGYGAYNKAKLLAIKSKYDPTGVFTRLQPGYFKLI